MTKNTNQLYYYYNCYYYNWIMAELLGSVSIVSELAVCKAKMAELFGYARIMAELAGFRKAYG
jgi:hypothetical protein